MTSWHYTLTLGDVASFRTGCPLLTIVAAAAYVLLLSLPIPGVARVWIGIAREAAISLYWTGRAVVRLSGRPLTAIGMRIPWIEGIIRAREAVRESRRNPDYTFHI